MNDADSLDYSRGILPLFLSQEAWWRFARRDMTSPVCRHAFAARLTGTVSLDAVHHGVETVLSRHAALRTAFIEGQDNLHQRIETETVLPRAEEIDLRDLDAEEQRAEIDWLVTDMLTESLDSAVPPLFRYEVFRCSDAERLIVFLAHRLVVDDRSADKLVAEFLRECRAGEDQLEIPDAPSLGIYSNLVLRQREQFQNGSWVTDCEFWRRVVSSPLTRLQLLADRGKPDVLSHQSATRSCILPEELCSRLAKLASERGTSQTDILLSCYALLLHMYSGESDILLGAMHSEQGLQKHELAIGSFSYPLPLRVEVSASDSLESLLTSVTETRRAMLRHAHMPAELALDDLEYLAPDRIWPWWQAVLSDRTNAVISPHDRTDCCERVQLEVGLTAHEWHLAAYRKPDGLELRLTYDVDTSEADIVDDALALYWRTLESIVATPHLSIGAMLDAISRSTRNETLASAKMGEEEADLPIEQRITSTLSQSFEQQVLRTPDNIAVRDRNGFQTYASLNHRANKIAHTLLAAGINPGDRIALLFEQNATLIAALLGVLKCGGVYVPLDISAPAARLQEIIDDAGARLLLTRSAYFSLAGECCPKESRVIDVDTISEETLDSNLKLPLSPDAPAYLIYTSGSTGRPKGVLQSHRNVQHFISVYANALAIGRDDRLTQLSGPGFDATVMDIYGALLNGASLHIVDLKRESFTELGARMLNEGITIYHSTPTVFRYFIESLAPGQIFTLPRCVVLGGETATRRDWRAFSRHFSGDCQLVNLYGSTESSISMIRLFSARTDFAGEIMPSGFPVENTEVVLIGEATERTPVYGEIAIISPHVALQYWNQPGLTAAVFVDDERSNVRMYRTGDLGRWSSQHGIVCCGRKDRQVKIRGYRVEPAEIEHHLSEHPRVKQCAVIAVPRSLESELVAFVIIRQSECQFAVSELGQFLETRVPGYMMPSTFHALESLPLTASGKIDQRRLISLARDLASDSL